MLDIIEYKIYFNSYANAACFSKESIFMLKLNAVQFKIDKEYSLKQARDIKSVARQIEKMEEYIN